MGSRDEGARGWGGAYWFVVVSGRACSVMGKTEKRELRPRGLRVGGLRTVIREVACSGPGCQGVRRTPGNRQRGNAIP